MWSFPGSYANRGSGTQQASSDVVVRVTGVEPARLSAREPKSRMSANSITGAQLKSLYAVRQPFSTRKTETEVRAFQRGFAKIRVDKHGKPVIIKPAVAGVAHLVERHLAKVEVASSSLVARSKLPLTPVSGFSLHSFGR